MGSLRTKRKFGVARAASGSTIAATSTASSGGGARRAAQARAIWFTELTARWSEPSTVAPHSLRARTRA
eukprot:SAG11_NODE_419_length_9648_cov_6.815478_9_plen_69_part_00